MKKKNAVQTISIPSAHSNNTLIHQTSNVSAKITLSDSILSGAVIGVNPDFSDFGLFGVLLDVLWRKAVCLLDEQM